MKSIFQIRSVVIGCSHLRRHSCLVNRRTLLTRLSNPNERVHVLTIISAYNTVNIHNTHQTCSGESFSSVNLYVFRVDLPRISVDVHTCSGLGTVLVALLSQHYLTEVKGIDIFLRQSLCWTDVWACSIRNDPWEFTLFFRDWQTHETRNTNTCGTLKSIYVNYLYHQRVPHDKDLQHSSNVIREVLFFGKYVFFSNWLIQNFCRRIVDLITFLHL